MTCRKLEQVRSFAAQSGATVQIPAASAKRSEQAGGQLGCLVLDLEEPLSETGDCRYGALIPGQHYGLLGIGAGVIGNAGSRKHLAEIISGDFQNIGPEHQERFAIVGHADPLRFLMAEMVAPSGNQPLRVVNDKCTGSVKYSLCCQRFFLADGLAQDAVDESLKSFRYAPYLAAFDHLMDRRRLRDTFKKKQLIKTNRQCLVDKWVDFRNGCL